MGQVNGSPASGTLPTSSSPQHASIITLTILRTCGTVRLRCVDAAGTDAN